MARRRASLDLISGGRSGWNVVTTGDAGSAANFSREEHFDYDTRYARGLEFVRVAQAIARGREPDHIVVMPGVRVYVGDTDQEARAIEREIQLTDQDFDKALAELGRPFAWHDFRQHDLDAPFPDVLHVVERGFRTQAEGIVKLARDNDLTLRQTVQFISSPKPTPFAGSPETVATEIQRWFEARALDGLNIHIGRPSQHRRFLNEVVPILQDRGVFRTEYESTTLRGNLGLPVPENRHTKSRLEAALLKI